MASIAAVEAVAAEADRSQMVATDSMVAALAIAWAQIVVHRSSAADTTDRTVADQRHQTMDA